MYISDEWIAGFVEGDGCFSKNVQQKGRYLYPKIEVHQKNLQPLEAMRDFGWKITTNGRLNVAYCVGRNAENIYSRISPFLSSKRRSQAEANLFTNSAPERERGLEWFAGYYEAEGCVSTNTNGKTEKKYVRLTISQYYSDETSRYCMEALGGKGRVSGPYMARGIRRAYAYNLAGKQALDVLDSIKHMLSDEKLIQLEKVKFSL